jgi:hypothetical protein
MNRAQLLGAYPHATALIERLCTVGPLYGSQEHQRRFVQRCHSWQCLAPCHTSHEHDAGCYPVSVVERVAREQR